MTLSSRRPYLLRAMYEWINDNGLTPYLLIDTSYPGVLAPMEFAQNHRLGLCISPSAIIRLLIDNEGTSFRARFGAKSMDVFLPMESILAIYAQENRQAMLFSDLAAEETMAESDADHPVSSASDPLDSPPPQGGGKPPRPTLRVVK